MKPNLSPDDINYLIEGDLFKVGDERIDAEHQQLFDIIDKARERDFDDVSDLLDQLKLYTLSHFAHEEDLLQKRGYPLLEDHKGFHKDLLDKISLMSSSSLASDDQKEEILELVTHWLKVHIFVHDKAYAQFLAEND